MKKMGCFLITLGVLMFLLFGCGDGKVSSSLSPLLAEEYTTPTGFKMVVGPVAPVYSQTWIIFDEKLAKEFVGRSLDQQISDCLSLYNNDVGLMEKARSIIYEVFNDYAFPCESYTGLCAGWTNKVNLIKSTLYGGVKNEVYPTFQTNPALVRTKEQMSALSGGVGIWITQGSNYYASDLWPYSWDYKWIGERVICHELQHCWGKISDIEKMEEENIHYTVFGF